MQAELLQQFALLQQADVEAKRQQEYDRNTSFSMYANLSDQIAEAHERLDDLSISRGNSTDAEQLLRQVLGAVEGLRAELVQQRVDSRTAEAVQHAMAAMAAAGAAAAAQQQQQQQHGQVVGDNKVRSLLGSTHRRPPRPKHALRVSSKPTTGRPSTEPAPQGHGSPPWPPVERKQTYSIACKLHPAPG